MCHSIEVEEPLHDRANLSVGLSKVERANPVKHVNKL